MRLIYAGTPEVAVPGLRSLLASRHDVVTVVTRQDAPLGRKRVLTPSPVATAASEAGIPVIKANRLDEAVTSELEALDADLGVIVAYGGLVREPLLSAPRLGWVNLHFSLLPAWRGAAPVQHALIAGETVTGASVFRLVPELDAGDLMASEPYAIDPDATAGDVLADLSVAGAELLTRTVDALEDGTAAARPQAGEVTFAPKLGIEDARLDFTRDAEQVYARFRGVTPEPGAFAEAEGVRVKIHEARRAPGRSVDPGLVVLDGRRVLVGTATSAIELITVQPAGKPRMRAADWWRGHSSHGEVRFA